MPDDPNILNIIWAGGTSGLIAGAIWVIYAFMTGKIVSGKLVEKMESLLLQAHGQAGKASEVASDAAMREKIQLELLRQQVESLENKVAKR